MYCEYVLVDSKAEAVIILYFVVTLGTYCVGGGRGREDGRRQVPQLGNGRWAMGDGRWEGDLECSMNVT